MNIYNLDFGEREAFAYWLEVQKQIDIDIKQDKYVDFNDLYSEYKQYKKFEELMWQVVQVRAWCATPSKEYSGSNTLI